MLEAVLNTGALVAFFVAFLLQLRVEYWRYKNNGSGLRCIANADRMCSLRVVVHASTIHTSRLVTLACLGITVTVLAHEPTHVTAQSVGYTAAYLCIIIAQWTKGSAWKEFRRRMKVHSNK